MKSSGSSVFRDLTKTIDVAAVETNSITPYALVKPGAASISLTDTLTCKTPKEAAALVSSLIIDNFNYENDKDDLTTQLTTYLTLVGVENNDILVFMSEST